MKNPVASVKISNFWLLTVIFIVLNLGLHLITSTNYELHRDEMLYFNMGSYPAFGYLTVPPKYRFIGVGILLVLLLFFLIKGKSYYITGLLPFLIAFGSFSLKRLLKKKIAIISLFGAAIIFSLSYVLPILSFQNLEKYAGKTGNIVPAPFMRWEDDKDHNVSQVFTDMTGWKELTEIVVKLYDKLTPEEKQRCTIFSERNYGYAGAIHFYGHKFELPEPITFLESYIFWAPDSIPPEPVIYIYYNDKDFSPYLI